MNIILRLGQWMDKKWPDKMTTSEVDSRFNAIQKEFDGLNLKFDKNNKEIYVLEADAQNHLGRISKLEYTFAILEQEMKTIRTNMTVKTRISSSNPTISPFATRQPTAIGGNS